MRFVYLIGEPTWTESRISDLLIDCGHNVEYRCHQSGDPLPAIDQFDGVIIGGGNVSVWEADNEPFMARQIAYTRQVVDAGVRFLGVCLGAQILGAAYGATSEARPDGWTEFGFYPIEATAAGAELFAGLDRVYQVHTEGLTNLPPEATLLATSSHFECQAFRIGSRAYGVQFHPDARADMIESWWHGNQRLQGRPGAQPLAEQLEHADRHEAKRKRWLSDFLDQWLTGAEPLSPTRTKPRPLSSWGT